MHTHTHFNKLQTVRRTFQATLTAYLGTDGSDIAWDFIRAGMQSVSKTTIIMMQVRGLCACGCVL